MSTYVQAHCQLCFHLPFIPAQLKKEKRKATSAGNHAPTTKSKKLDKKCTSNASTSIQLQQRSNHPLTIIHPMHPKWNIYTATDTKNVEKLRVPFQIPAANETKHQRR